MSQQKIHSTPKKMHLPCILEVAGSAFFRGELQELSEIEASAHIPALAIPDIKKPVHGASCVLNLSLRGSGGILEILKIPCHVMYVATVLVRLNLNIEDLDERQRETLDALFD